MPRLNIGGSEQAIPTHARVIMLGFPLGSTQVTSTTGQGNRAVYGFFCTFINSHLEFFMWIIIYVIHLYQNCLKVHQFLIWR